MWPVAANIPLFQLCYVHYGHYALDWLRDSRLDCSSLSVSITIRTINYLYLYYLSKLIILVSSVSTFDFSTVGYLTTLNDLHFIFLIIIVYNITQNDYLMNDN